MGSGLSDRVVNYIYRVHTMRPFDIKCDALYILLWNFPWRHHNLRAAPGNRISSFSDTHILMQYFSKNLAFAIFKKDKDSRILKLNFCKSILIFYKYNRQPKGYILMMYDFLDPLPPCLNFLLKHFCETF